MANGDVTWGDNVIYADFGGRGDARGGTRGARGKKGAAQRRKAGGKVVRPRTEIARRVYDASRTGPKKAAAGGARRTSATATCWASAWSTGRSSERSAAARSSRSPW
nr:hypothetical protein [Corynebacterium xerosis]